MSHRIRVVPVVLALAFVGCKDALEPKLKCGIAGSSNVSVTGAVTVSVDGCATYGVSTGTGASTVVTLAGGSLTAPTHSIVFTRSGARPANGSYTVGVPSPTNISGTFTSQSGSLSRTFGLTGGTVNITNSANGTLSGTLVSVTATEGSGASAPTVTLSGNFSAKCVDTETTDC